MIGVPVVFKLSSSQLGSIYHALCLWVCVLSIVLELLLSKGSSHSSVCLYVLCGFARMVFESAVIWRMWWLMWRWHCTRVWKVRRYLHWKLGRTYSRFFAFLVCLWGDIVSEGREFTLLEALFKGGGGQFVTPCMFWFNFLTYHKHGNGKTPWYVTTLIIILEFFRCVRGTWILIWFAWEIISCSSKMVAFYKPKV